MDDNEILLAAFDDVGGSVVQPMALKMALEKRGLSTENAAVQIDAAIQAGVLVPTERGGLRLSTKLS